MLDLLTDPRILPEDYLWFGDDPFGAPPTEWLELEDIDDGLAYRKTYERVTLPQPYTETGRRRVLLPVIGYMCWRMLSWGLVCYKIGLGPEYPGLDESEEYASWSILHWCSRLVQ
jgi:hypothetical protein